MTAELSTSGDDFSVNGGKITDVADGVDPTDAANVSQIVGGSGAPDDADYLVGTANGGLSAEIVVGTTPGGELGGTWASPTVDATHSGSTHAAVQSAAEATAAAALGAHTGDTSDAHDASAISADSTTLVGTGTDVQAVLEEMDDAIAALAGGAGVPTSTIDAKGDLLVGSANDAIDNLTVGANDTLLVADSGQTLGVKWATLPGGAQVPVSTIDAKGDLLVGSANDAIDNLTVGTNDFALIANSSATLGVNWARPPGSEISYVERATDASITATTAAGANTVISSDAIAYDGSTKIIIEFYAALCQCDTDGVLVITLWDGSTDLNRMAQFANIASGSTTGQISAGLMAQRILTPSNATHTYHFKAFKTAGTAAIGAVAGTYLPAFIRITKA